MLIIQIDRLNPQTAKASVARLSDAGRRAIGSGDRPGGIDPEATLRRDDSSLARDLSQKAADQLLVLIRTIDLRCIEKVTPEFEVAAQYG